MSKKKKQIQDDQRKRLEEISGFIKNYRICGNLSQREYSKISNVHVNTLQKFEKHYNNISVHTLFALIDSMDEMTLSEFFAGMQ